MGYLPQLYKGYKTKKLEDVSYYMPAILAIGMTLWLVYGLFLEALGNRFPTNWWFLVPLGKAVWIICGLFLVWYIKYDVLIMLMGG